MSKIPWIGHDEIITWLDNPINIPDLLNRPLRKALELAGISADDDFDSFGINKVLLTADKSETGTALVDTGLQFTLSSGGSYSFKFLLAYTSTDTTVGLKVGLTHPGATNFGALVIIPAGATDGVDATTQGYITSSGDAVTALSTPTTAGLVYIAIVEGIIHNATAGLLKLRFACEVAGSITVKAGSMGTLIRG